MHLNKVLTFILSLMVLTAAVFITGCNNGQKQDTNIVAKIGDDYVITFNDLRKFVFDRLYNKQYRDKMEAYNQALEAMITDQLKIYDFFDKNLNMNQELIQSIQRFISEELILEYFKTQFLAKYTSEEYARKIYDRIGKQVVYRQIVLYKSKKASNRQLDSLKTISAEIKARIDKKEEFDQLVKQYSQHTESSNSGGFMPPVSWEQSMSNPIDNMIFNLNIGDVRILEAYNAYHIVEVTDIKKIDIEPFDKIKNNIIAKLEKGYLVTSLEEYDAAMKKLVNPDTLEWNEKTLNQLVQWSEIPNFYLDIYKDTIQNAISNGKNLILVTYPDGQVDFKEYLRLLNTVLIPQNTQNISKKDTKDFILEALRSDIIVKKAKELDLEKNIFNARMTNPILKAQITKLYDQAVIESQIPEPTSDVLHKFYESQKDSLYYHLKKINIYAMIFAEEKKANEIMQSIKNGTPFEKISGNWFVKTFVRDRDGQVKSYLSQDKPFLGEAAFKLQLNETSGPIEYDDPEKGKQYAIIKCVNIRPEKQLLFDEVKNSITEDFKIDQRKKLKGENREQLWKKYSIEIYKDVLTKKLISLD